MRKWQSYKNLGDVVTIIMGQSPSSDTYNDKEGLPFFQGNADFGKEHPTVRVFCNSPIRIAEPNDILISVRAPIGAINIADRQCCIGRGLAAIRGANSVSNRFLYFFLTASKNTLISQGTGSTFKSIGKDALKNLQMPVFNLNEQERIVSELDLLAGIIDKQKQQLKELDTLAQSIFYDMFGSPVENDKNWNINRLGGVLKTTSGGTPSKSHSEYYEGGTIPWVNSGDLHQMYIYSVQKFITQEGVDNSSAKLFPINSVLIAMYGATVGEVSILKIESTTNQAVCCIFPNDAYDSIFLYSVMKNSKHYFVDKASGGAQSNISQGVIKDFLLITPPIELQKSFAKKIQSIESQKQSINRSIAESQKLFDYTMDKYFG